MPWLKNKKLLPQLQHWFTPQRSNNHRPKILHSDSLMILAFFAIGFFSLIQSVRLFPSLKNSILGFSSTITIDQVVVQTNEQRSAQGLKPLSLDSRLSAAALAKAQDMLDNQYWSHTSPDGKQPWDFMKAANYSYRVAGENLARDFRHTHDMIAAWMASPTHKANVINSQYEQIGVAVVNGKLEGFDTTLVVQMFGTPPTQTAAVSDTSAQSSSGSEVQAVQTDSQTEPQTQPPTQEPPAEPTDTSEQTLESDSVILEIESTDVEATDAALIDQYSTQNDFQDQASEFGAAARPTETSLTGVLASALVPIGSLGESPLFTPLQMTKIFFLGIILMIVLTLSYDSFVIGNKKTMRLVGQNLGHIILFICIAFLMILFKGGVIR